MNRRSVALAVAVTAILFAFPVGSRAQCTGCPNPSFGPALVVPQPFSQYFTVDTPTRADFDLDGTLDLAVGASDGMVNGAVTAGAGTRMITFKAGPTGPVTIGINVVVPGLPCLLERSVQVAVDSSLSCPGPVGFFTVAPCRVVDTRETPGPWGGPPLTGGGIRVFAVSGRCGIPATARAVAVNLTAVGPTQGGHLTLYPVASASPESSTINFRAGIVRANNAILPLGAAGDLAVLCSLAGTGSTHFLLDVSGYFE